MNSVKLSGRLTADPELKMTPQNVAVTTFILAVDRRTKEDKADFPTIVAWRQTAEFVHKYFTKGSSIFVVGTLQNRSWTDNHGVKHYATDVVADEVSFVDSRSEAPAADAASGEYVPQAYTAPAGTATGGAMTTVADEDLPF